MRRAHRRLVVAGLAVGVADGLVFLGFEWVAKDVTHWVWNDLAGSDAARWRVLPLAIVLSLGLSAVLRWTRQPRWIPPHLDPLESAEHGDGGAPPSPAALGATLAAGGASMVAGASLGPEAPLMGFAAGLGAWVAARAAVAAETLVLASVGAWALAGIVVVKLLVTSWSLSTGYRGGLVFPSVFAGVAISLLVASVLPGVAGPGILLGSVAGLLVEMTAPALGAILLLALLPGALLPLGFAGAAGAIAGRALLGRIAQGADAQRGGGR